MKCTKIRIDGRKPSRPELEMLCEAIEIKIGLKGFISEAEIINSTHIKISYNSKQFILDTSKHDRNLQNNPFGCSKLTSLPTWEQRVEFNEAINEVFDRYDVSSKITSGPYTIRDGKTKFHEDDWHYQKPDWVRHNESRGYYIESVDVEAYLEAKRIERNERARKRRREAKIEAKRSSFELVQGGL